MRPLLNSDGSSRLLMGTANFPSLAMTIEAIQAAKASIITVSLKRENPKERGGQTFWEAIQKTGCQLLPNTAGCRTAGQAVEVARMAKDIFQTNWIKLEIIGDDYLLQPDPFELIKASKALIDMGFVVFPYCTEDLILCQKLVDNGCQILMPWGAPIGSGKGLLNTFHLKILRERFPQIALIIDAGIGSPEHAMQAMLMGYDAVLVNSAIAKAISPVKMAEAFELAVRSGRLAYEAGLMPTCDFAAQSTPLPETFFWINDVDKAIGLDNCRI